jgi:hypothetical protein
MVCIFSRSQWLFVSIVICHSLSLIDSNGTIVATKSVGNTCGKQELSFGNFSVHGI